MSESQGSVSQRIGIIKATPLPSKAVPYRHCGLDPDPCTASPMWKDAAPLTVIAGLTRNPL